jgi:hypothetical protein
MEDSVKLTDTQLRLLAAASQRDDRALEWPSNLTGSAAGKVVAKLLIEGLVEEIQSHGSLPVWRRDDKGARSLRVTKKGFRRSGSRTKRPSPANRQRSRPLSQ